MQQKRPVACPCSASHWVSLTSPSFRRKSGGHEQLTDGGDVPDTDSSDSDSEVDEVEMVLEAYFMQLDNTFNKLQTLCEYIDDTEVSLCLPCVAVSNWHNAWTAKPADL